PDQPGPAPRSGPARPAADSLRRRLRGAGPVETTVRTGRPPKLREFLAARGLRLSDEKTRIVRDTEGFDFVGRQFKRLSPTKFLVRPRRRSVGGHRNALLALFRNHAIPVGQQIQRANA